FFCYTPASTDIYTLSLPTLFRSHLNGLLRPTSGKLYVDGEDVWEQPKEIRQLRFKVGLVFQYPEYQLFDETVEKDIGFGPRNMGDRKSTRLNSSHVSISYAVFCM